MSKILTKSLLVIALGILGFSGPAQAGWVMAIAMLGNRRCSTFPRHNPWE